MIPKLNQADNYCTETQQYLSQFQRCNASDDNQGALTAALAMAQLNPQQDELWFTLGCCYSKSSDFPQAVTAFNKAQKINPYNAQYALELALCFKQMGQAKSALKYFKTAQKLAPDQFKHYGELGVILCKLGKKQKARKCFTTAIQLNCDDLTALMGCAQLEQLERNFPQAIAFYERVLKINPNNTTASSNLGFLLLERNLRQLYC